MSCSKRLLFADVAEETRTFRRHFKAEGSDSSEERKTAGIIFFSFSLHALLMPTSLIRSKRESSVQCGQVLPLGNQLHIGV